MRTPQQRDIQHLVWQARVASAGNEATAHLIAPSRVSQMSQTCVHVHAVPFFPVKDIGQCREKGSGRSCDERISEDGSDSSWPT